MVKFMCACQYLIQADRASGDRTLLSTGFFKEILVLSKNFKNCYAMG